MDIIKAGQAEPTRTDEAQRLHFEILKNGEDAAAAMVSFALNLKKMRDEKLYSELGYESFELYTVEAVGLKKSQAYDYISALERLGSEELKRVSPLGITKIKLLSAFNPLDRAEFLEQNDVSEMSARQLKEKIADLTKQGEQLSFELSNAKERTNDGLAEIERLESEKAELEKRLKELENKPHEVAVREPTDEEKAEMISEKVEKQVSERTAEMRATLESLKKDKKRLNDEKTAAEKRLKDETKKAAQKAVEDYKKKNELLVAEIEKAKERSKELEKQIKVSSSPEMTRFGLCFEAVQENMQKLLDILSGMSDAETAGKLKENLIKYADMLKRSVEAV